MHAHGAPVRLPVKKWPWLATSTAALQNTPKKATRSTSTTHSRFICCEIFGLKYLVLSLHRSTAQISLKAGLSFSSFSVRNYTGYLGKSPETYTNLTGGYHGDKHREGNKYTQKKKKEKKIQSTFRSVFLGFVLVSIQICKSQSHIQVKLSDFVGAEG